MESAPRAAVRPLVGAILASVGVVVGSPYIGQIRTAFQAAVPGQYHTIVIVTLAAVVVAAVGAAVVRIREHRAARYTLLGAALAIAIVYARLTRSDNVDQDLAGQFHFLEYGLLAYLFFRVWRHCGDLRTVVLPLCAGVIVGAADEGFQWFVPSRVGEFYDVLINTVGVACGLLFSVGAQPSRRIELPPSAPVRRAVCTGLAAVCVVIALFVELVHRGHVIPETDVGRFRSTFSRAALEAAAADRASRWRVQPPANAQGLAREDHYLSEGRWHVQRRNEARDGADLWTAWNENLILEKYFAPVLDLDSRWSAEDRAILAASTVASANGYVSDAEPYPILVVAAWRFWLGVASLVAAVWLVTAGRPRRVSRPLHV